MNACLGLAWLGMCHYDPAAPSPAYFTLGNAVSALAFTLAMQTFLKPIYRLRLSVRYLALGHLYELIFLAVVGYAIFWELIATILFSVAYGAVAVAVDGQAYSVDALPWLQSCKSASRLSR